MIKPKSIKPILIAAFLGGLGATIGFAIAGPKGYVDTEGLLESRIKVELITIDHHRFAVATYDHRLSICEVTEASHD